MDSDRQSDAEHVRRHLEQAEVVGVFFPLLRCTLLLDVRSNQVDPPLVIVVPMVASAEERLRSVSRLRPRFPRPESMSLIPWPRSVSALQETGIWNLIEDHVVALGGEAMRPRCRFALDELKGAEHRQVRGAITGEGYKTIWERRAT